MAARVLPEDLKKRYVLDEFVLEPDLRRLCRADAPVHLAHRPFQALLYLIEHRDRMVSRAELLDQFWEGRDVYDATLSKCVGAIRRALGDTLDQPRFIETRWAEGYRYLGPLEEQTIEPEPSLLEIERTRAVRIVVEEELQEATASQLSFTVSRPSRRVVTLALAAVTLAGMAVAFTRSRLNPEPNLPVRSIAVLPLRNLTGDPAQEYFSDGLTESFITEFSRISGLKVISRASVFTFKGRDADAREVGRALGVAAVMEGSVRRSADRVRVAVRVVSAADGRVIWASETYDRAFSDIFAVQDEIACRVSASLQYKLCREAASQSQPRNPEAYRAYLMGRYHWNKRTPEGLRQAIASFEQATRLDPDYALAWCGLADSYNLSVWYIPLPTREALPKMKAAAQRALALDETLAEAHLAMSNVLAFEWDWTGNLKEKQRAVELNPGSSVARHWYALYLGTLGRMEQALVEIRRAQELDPLSAIINTDLGWLYYTMRRCDEAIRQYQQTLELEPNFPLARLNLALALSKQGRHDEAIAECRRVADKGSNYLAALGYLYGVAGRRSEARQTLSELHALARKQYVPPYHFAWVHLGLGRQEQALTLLEEVYRERSILASDFRVHPLLDSLRTDPRFISLERSVGLPG